MVQSYLLIPDIDGPYWTMIIEMIFYILVLIIFNLKLIKIFKSNRPNTVDIASNLIYFTITINLFLF